jgi:hypothetical protein
MLWRVIVGDRELSPSGAKKPANVLSEARCERRKAVFFFRLSVILPEGEGLSGRSEPWQRTVSSGPSRQS